MSQSFSAYIISKLLVVGALTALIGCNQSPSFVSNYDTAARGGLSNKSNSGDATSSSPSPSDSNSKSSDGDKKSPSGVASDIVANEDSSLALQSEIPVVFETVSDPIKLVLVVDDSMSMASKQQQLSQGLEKTFAKLRNKNVTVYLYSSSLFATGFKFFNTNYVNLYRYRAAGSTDAFMNWGGIYIPNDLSKSQRPSLDVEATLSRGGVWSAALSTQLDFIPDEALTKFVIAKSAFATTDGSIVFKANLSDADFKKAMDQLKAQVLIGETGASEERTLCTLASLLQNEGKNKLFAAGDRTAFLLISDEDQSTVPGNCPYTVQTSIKKYDTVRASAYHRETYVIMDYGRRCDNDSSGASVYCFNQPWAQHIHTSCSTNALCDQTRPADGKQYDCSDAQKADYITWFNNTYKTQLASGTMKFDGTTRCIAVNDYYIRLGTEVVAIGSTKSTAFVKNGVTYATLVDYFKSKFPNDIFNGEVWFDTNIGAPTSVQTSLPGLGKAADLPMWIRDKAKNLFGADNFVISSIANLGAKNPVGCNLDLASESKQIQQVSDFTSSVCAPDYTENLKWLEQFTSKKIIREYALDPAYVGDAYVVKLQSVSATASAKDIEIDKVKGVVRILSTPSADVDWTLSIYKKIDSK